ncbi:hypothetical protein JST97_20125 [bacterium]|nr:hypothetical protein [bacterium]
MDILLRRTLKRTGPLALCWLLWAIGLAFVLSVPHGRYQMSVWRWLELIVPATYVAWIASAWVELGHGKAMQEVELVTDPRRWIFPVLGRGLGLWAVLALAEVSAGAQDLQWFLFVPLMLTLISEAGMALAQQRLPVLTILALGLVPLFTADWRATLPSLAILTVVLVWRCRWRGSLPTTIVVVGLGAYLIGTPLWILMLICLTLLCAEASFRTADEVIKSRQTGFWTDICATPLGQRLFCRRISLSTARALLPPSVALAGLLILSIVGHPQSTVSCGMWTSCLCDAPHPDRDEWAGNLACWAGAVALVTPLAANRLGLLVGVLARGRSQALLLITGLGLILVALSGGSCIAPLMFEEGDPGPFYHDWLQRMLGLSVLAALLSECIRGRNWRPLTIDGPLPWLPVWLCLGQTSLHIYELCSQMSLVMVPQDVVFVLLWISAAAQGLLGSLVFLCLRPRRTALVAVYGLAAGLWAQRCPSYLPVVGLVLALLLHKSWRPPHAHRKRPLAPRAN